jgi:hypothetical protein
LINGSDTRRAHHRERIWTMIDTTLAALTDHSITPTTLSALYDAYGDAAGAVGDLEAAGISTADISVLVNNQHGHSETSNAGTGAEAGAGVGAVVGGGAGVLAGLGMLAIPGIGPVVAAGWLIAALAGAAAGAGVGAAAGGIVGSMTTSGVPEDHAQVFAEGVRRGGALVSVRAQPDKVELIRSVLNRHSPVDPVTRGAAYRKAGWRAFDETATQYTAADAERERTLF